MRAVIQRVRSASVETNGQVAGQIGPGLLVYVGVSVADTGSLAPKLADKLAHLRIFEDQAGKMNRSVQDIGGGLLVVPNFTLQADARKGRRPAFVDAARPDQAQPIFERLLAELESLGCTVGCGVFGADMTITSIADGPVNIVLDLDAP